MPRCTGLHQKQAYLLQGLIHVQGQLPGLSLSLVKQANSLRPLQWSQGAPLTCELLHSMCLLQTPKAGVNAPCVTAAPSLAALLQEQVCSV